MFTIEIAGLLVEIDNRYEDIKKRCEDYIVMPDRKPDIRAGLSDEVWEDVFEAWEGEKANVPDLPDIVDVPARGVIEDCLLPSRIYPQLPQFDAAWLHACAVEVDGEGYAFTAPSGYGKTTQALLWLDYFGSRARIINGDNPIIRFINGGCYICGTPFGGSEGYQYNTQVPLKGICFLNHSSKNKIIRMDQSLAFSQLLSDNQKHRMVDCNNLDAMMSVWERIVEAVPVWQLHCNQSMEAVKVAYRGMRDAPDMRAEAH